MPPKAKRDNRGGRGQSFKSEAKQANEMVTTLSGEGSSVVSSVSESEQVTLQYINTRVDGLSREVSSMANEVRMMREDFALEIKLLKGSVVRLDDTCAQT